MFNMFDHWRLDTVYLNKPNSTSLNELQNNHTKLLKEFISTCDRYLCNDF